MRLIVQPIAGCFELCARLGLVLVPDETFFGKVVHSVLDDSPCAQAGIEPREIILALDNVPWASIRHLNFSDRRSSEVKLKTFVARYFAITDVMVRVPPEPYRPIEEIASEAANAIALRPAPDSSPYRNPRFEEMHELLAGLSRRRCRR